MFGFVMTRDLELLEGALAENIDEVGTLRRSLQLIAKKMHQLEKDNKFLMELHKMKIADEPKPKKVATKTIKPRKKATKKEVK